MATIDGVLGADVGDKPRRAVWKYVVYKLHRHVAIVAGLGSSLDCIDMRVAGKWPFRDPGRRARLPKM